jgi:hypothetical protein
MLRLAQSDFEDRHDLAKLAGIANLSIEEFQERFGYLVA